MSMTMDTIYKVSSSCKWRKYLSGIVIDPDVALNTTATYVFEAIDGSKSVQKIVDQIAGLFLVEKSECQADVVDLLNSLSSRGVIDLV